MTTKRETISFTEDDLRRLKMAHHKALKDGVTSFLYKENEYDTGYAKYLIQYLESRLSGLNHDTSICASLVSSED